MTIEEKQREITDEFNEIDDWLDRYAAIIDAGQDLPELDPKYKTPEYLIDGCQSSVWLHSYLDDNGHVRYEADSNTSIVMLVSVLDDRTPDEIINADLHFINDIGLGDNLSPYRANGLLAMLKQMKYYAVAFKGQQEKGQA